MTTNTFGCVNNTIKLASGGYIDLTNPQPADIHFYDIANALANICRFGGQIEEFYSVAEHSYLATRIAEEDGQPVECCRAVLLHDAAEAYLGDVVKPLKLLLPEYANLEKRMEAVIATAFNIDFDRWSTEIREIDQAMLIAERKAFFKADGVEWTGERDVRIVQPKFIGEAPKGAFWMFTQAFERLRRFGIY